MRAIVSLYHQSETFITPETLDQRIDQAFLQRPEHVALGDAGAQRVYRSYVELGAIETQREKIPRVSEHTPWQAGPSAHDDGWSDIQHERERAVVEALYGTVEQTKPGWEILEESAEGVQKDITEDRKNGYPPLE